MRIHYSLFKGLCMCLGEITLQCGSAGVRVGSFMGPQAKLEIV